MSQANPAATAPQGAQPAHGARAMSRGRAALIHLALSIAVFSAVIVPLLMLWYPPPLFFSDGGWNVVQIAAGVDIVIGPLLTLLVFKSGKKGLKFDLCVIAVMQVAALAWGVHLMYQQRPLLLAFAEDRFSTVTLGQLFESQRPIDELMKLDDDRPVRVFVRMPDDPAEATKLKIAQGMQGKSVFRLTDRYEPMTPANLAYVYRRSINMDLYLKRLPESRAEYDSFLAHHGTDARELAFVPLHCRYEDLILVLRRSDGGIAGSLHIPPPDYNILTPAEKTGVT